VTWVRPKHGMATGAFVEEEARICWHCLAGREAALWTREDGLECRLRLHVMGPSVGRERRLQASEARRRASTRWNGYASLVARLSASAAHAFVA
jgi:hypothetical protein